ncbi:MAG: single-stranded-DNA-specific exonuclease RecJ [Betaproteobacteria bacterium]|nr:single-stranded-DNA-specific exonuclease RecJ [Betaproteobacteria bacterium]
MKHREVHHPSVARLTAQGMPPLLARVYAARGVSDMSMLGDSLDGMLPPTSLKGIRDAVSLLTQAIAGDQKILIIADYDCDGATACAVAVRGLRMMGAQVDYLVPNRLVHGYGLTPPIVELALKHPRLGRPALLVTVDNGIASHEGIQAANAAGLQVLVTDHHLPADTLPSAAAIVNPNQPGCAFPSKNLAGVGVMFYVLAALRARHRDHAPHSPAAQAPLQTLLDLVALGSIADVVRLDENNRRLVHAGLRRIRAGQACAGIAALFAQAGRDPRSATSSDLGFVVGPRINAAGRLADISLGIACLLADDPIEAALRAQELDAINRDRRELEQTMREQAIASVGAPPDKRCSIVVHDPSWHEGVIGLVAGQLKNRFGRPAFAFAPTVDRSGWRGSGRSVPGIHLRDALDLVSKRMPHLIIRFGGHAMAAGLSLSGDSVDAFANTLEQVLVDTADPECLQPELIADGELDPGEASLEIAEALGRQVWGQGFPEPIFAWRFHVLGQRIVGERHLKLELMAGRRRFDAIAFGRDQPLPATPLLAYRLSVNEYRGIRSLQLVIEECEEEAGL